MKLYIFNIMRPMLSHYCIVIGLYGIPLSEVVKQMYASVVGYIDTSEHLQDVVFVDKNQSSLTMLYDLFNQEIQKYHHVRPIEDTLYLGTATNTERRPSSKTQKSSDSEASARKTSPGDTPRCV